MAMMRFMKADLDSEVHGGFLSDLTLEQVKVLVKLAKHVRGRCRNNSAFNNYFNQMFPKFRFEQVEVVLGSAFGGYKKLVIVERRNNAAF